jgi:sigma-B regulation protein RsbU (phosphoserine phosphatase)
VTTPVVYQYQRALDEFRREGREPPLLKRMSELISLLDLTTTLGSSLSGDEILDAALLIVMGELQVARGALFVAEGEGGFRRRAARGLAADAPERLEMEAPAAAIVPAAGEPASRAGFALICPVRRGGRTVALLGLGPRAGGQPFGHEELGFLESLAACAATPIENGIVHEELRRANESLSLRIFQLEGLFDIGRELTTSLDEDAIVRLLIATVMGHFLASRCALYEPAEDGALRTTHARGVRPDDGTLPVTAELLARELPGPRAVATMAAGPLRDALSAGRFALAVPLAPAGGAGGVLAVGERPGGRAFSVEDLDFAAALARQAQTAFEGARLHRVRVEKERQDRDLQIAREIQQSLFPPDLPQVPGFELAAISRSCYEVGGDYYDVMRLDGGRLGLVVADVSGKGTPASIMMASVHASLEAMAGSGAPAQLLQRLNRFLFERTQTSRYVTLFYGELDPARRALVYVNAGHVPPYLLRADGSEERLRIGGPVVGLLEDAAFEAGEVVLRPGDLLATVTDGVTEAMTPAGEEFGDARTLTALRRARGRNAEDAIQALVEAVAGWTSVAGCSDDLTVLTLRAT